MSEMMSGQGLVPALLFIYGLSFLVSTPAAIKQRTFWLRAGLLLLIAGFLLNSWIVADRWIESGRPPFKTLYETLIFYPWCVAVVTFALIAIHRLYVLVPFAGAVSAIGLAYAVSSPDIEIVNLPPALRSGWFVPHVVTYFVSYAALFASFALAALAIAFHHYKEWKPDRRETALLGKVAFEKFAHNSAVFGTVTLTLGLVMGAAWGKFAWGDYWGWDPKENWALISWLLYMIYFHLGLLGYWKGQRGMWILVLAFGAIIFTYLGMSLLPTAQDSLHVYQ